MSYSVFVKSSKEGKFIDFVVAASAKGGLKRVDQEAIKKLKAEASPRVREDMDRSFNIAMMDLDYKARNGNPIHRDWKAVAKKIEGASRIGG